VTVVYKQRGQRLVRTAQAKAVREIPANSKASDWEPYLMLAYGIKLGGSEALADSGVPIYKGQNIFPAGVLGDPMGSWNVKTSKVDSLRLYDGLPPCNIGVTGYLRCKRSLFHNLLRQSLMLR
jgi:hypothetical protein